MTARPTPMLVVASIAAFAAAFGTLRTVYWPDRGLLIDNGRHLVGQDFVNLWTAARLAADGRAAEIYDLLHYDGILKAWFSPDHAFQNFSYPPTALLLLGPLGEVPYLAALAGWSVLGLVAAAVVALRAATADQARRWVPILVTCPAVVVAVLQGQASLLLAALLLAGLQALPSRPALSGMLLGLMSVKPQLGLLIPPALLVLGNRRAFLAAAATAAALVGSSVIAFGTGIWADFLFRTLPFQRYMTIDRVGPFTLAMSTPFAAFAALGVPPRIALVLHAGVAAAIAIATLRILQGPAAWPLKVAVMATASVLVTPYCVHYDLAIAAVAIVYWLASDPVPLAPATVLAIATFWSAPLLGLVLLHARIGVPLFAVATLGVFVALARHAADRPSGSRPVTPPARSLRVDREAVIEAGAGRAGSHAIAASE